MRGTARNWRSVVNRLLGQPSFEIAPGQDRDLGPIFDQLHPDTQLFVANIAGKPLNALTETLERMSPRGFDLIPHIAARNFESKKSFADFSEVLGRLNVQSAFVVGGGASRAEGPYNDAESLLKEITLLADAGIENLGFAGYPEGHPAISNVELNEALAIKV